MSKAFIRRYLPSPERIREQKSLGFLRHRLGDPSLWYLNRRSASLAVFWGLFCAFLPIPMQMIPATLAAVILRINLPLIIVLIWLTNPLTILPFMYASYWVGSHAMQVPMVTWAQLQHLGAQMLHVSSSLEATGDGTQLSLLDQLKPFLLGSVLLGLALGALGYVLMQGYWRWHVVHAWKQRAKKRGLKP